MAVSHSTQITAVGYLRRSTRKQEKSIADQKRAIGQWADDQGYRIVRWYVDDGISGDSTEQRSDFLQMRADAERGDFEAVLCWDQDRFGRFDSLDAGYWCPGPANSYAPSGWADLPAPPPERVVKNRRTRTPHVHFQVDQELQRSISPEQVGAFSQLQSVCVTQAGYALPPTGWVCRDKCLARFPVRRLAYPFKRDQRRG